MPTQDLVSSVPGIFTALVGLIQTAAAAETNQTNVAVWELGNFVTPQYVIIESFTGPNYEWETLGAFSQYELYAIDGTVRLWTGDSPFEHDDLTSVPLQVLQDTYSLFQRCVMTPVMSNRTMPLLNTTGPTPLEMLPGRFSYEHGPGHTDKGEPWGWQGLYHWQFTFRALLTPA